MRIALTAIASLIVLMVIAVALIAFVPIRTTPPQQQLPADYKPPAGRGEYIMRLGDCEACHTAEGGARFAGGRALESPFGSIISTNITPDPETGIGKHTLDDFRAALYDGVRPDGELLYSLYPAMPYENYRKISEEDVRALYDYFMNEVPAVSNRARPTDLAFPFNQRWAIRVWDWLALDEPGFTPRYDDAALDRGAYIVEGLAHCGACHTPRDVIFAQPATTAEDAAFLSGGTVGEWPAQDLRGPDSAPQRWTASELKNFLATGRNGHAAVTGEMSLVVRDSLQYLSPQDLDAIVSYLRHIGTAGEAAAPDENGREGTIKLLSSADPDMELGPRLYLDNCNACHFVDGKGAAEVFPALDGNSLVVADQTAGLIDVILYGARLPSTKDRPAALAMPGFGHRLTDGEVAELATFLRGAWSNDAGAIDPEAVAARRKPGIQN